MHTFVHSCVYVGVHTCECLCMCAGVCMFACVCTCECVYVCMCECVCACMHTFVRLCVYVGVLACECLCVTECLSVTGLLAVQLMESHSCLSGLMDAFPTGEVFIWPTILLPQVLPPLPPTMHCTPNGPHSASPSPPLLRVCGGSWATAVPLVKMATVCTPGKMAAIRILIKDKENSMQFYSLNVPGKTLSECCKMKRAITRRITIIIIIIIML